MAFQLSVSIAFLIALLILMPSSALAEEYLIKTKWNNLTIDHPDNPVTIQLLKEDDQSFKIVVSAPFFNDPKGPPVGPTLPGVPLFQLYECELVKVFFLNKEKGQYIEIQLGAWGGYFVVLFNGMYNRILYGLSIDYSVPNHIDKKWQGTAIIPLDYLPPTVNKMNIFSFHGADKLAKTEALFPHQSGATILDDHKFDNFGPFDWKILRSEDPGTLSPTWTFALQTPWTRNFIISNTWDGKPLSSKEAVELNLKLDDTRTNMIFRVIAPLYNDSAPNKSDRGSFPMLNKPEVVIHLYLLGYPSRRFLEIELEPFGDYLVAFWKVSENRVPERVGNLNSTIAYNPSLINDTHWNRTVKFPLGYLPPQVQLFNAFVVHGNGTERRASSLYPIPPEKLGNRTMTDFHLFEFYKSIDLSVSYPDNNLANCSQIWQELVKDCPTSSAGSLFAGNTIIFLPIALTFIGLL